jgi:HK97 family phage major capsid protein
MKNLIEKKKGERLALVNNNAKIVKEATARESGWTADETTTWENRDADIEKLNKEIQRLEKQWQDEEKLNKVEDSRFKPEVGDVPQNKVASKEYSDAFFNGFARKGKNGMDPKHFNALEVGTDAEGGYLVPQEWASNIVRDLAELVVMRKYANVIVTASDRNIPLQTSRGTFTWIAEEGAYSTNDPAYNNLVLSAHKLGGIIQVSEELLQDNSYNLAGALQTDAAEEFADKEEDAFVDGDDSGKPEGVFQVSTVGGVSVAGYTGAVSATAAVTYADLVNTLHTLGARYRKNAAWLMSDGHAKLIRLLVDGQSRPLWEMSVQAGQPDRLLGQVVEISDSSPAPATASRGICFGDFGYYTIVDRLNMTAQRLHELYAANGQIGFKFTKRVDGGLTQANAMTYFAHGAAS